MVMCVTTDQYVLNNTGIGLPTCVIVLPPFYLPPSCPSRKGRKGRRKGGR